MTDQKATQETEETSQEETVTLGSVFDDSDVEPTTEDEKGGATEEVKAEETSTEETKAEESKEAQTPEETTS